MKKIKNIIRKLILKLHLFDFKSYITDVIKEVKLEYIAKLKNGDADFLSATRSLPKEFIEEIIEDILNDIIKKNMGDEYIEEEHKLDL